MIQLLMNYLRYSDSHLLRYFDELGGIQMSTFYLIEPRFEGSVAG